MNQPVERLTGYKPGTRFMDALMDGWMRELPLDQRVAELGALGFYVNKVFLMILNENLTKEMDAWFEANQGEKSEEVGIVQDLGIRA